MMTYVLAAALAAALTTSAYAQNMPAKSSTERAPSSQMQSKPSATTDISSERSVGFMQSQSAGEWRSSKLVGTSVYGPDDKSIGKISDILIDNNGGIKAVVIGVGGFLGMGEKDVAVPFKALKVTRKQNSSSIEKITVTYTKDQLKNAPKFAFYQAPGSSTTGSSPAASAPRAGAHPPAGMGK